MRASKRPSNSERTSKQTKSQSTLDLKEFYPKRSNEARKGDFGRVIICGGSDRYAGCLTFNSLAALRAGADLAVTVAPRRAANIVAGCSPDLITVPCDTPFPDPDTAMQMLENADSMVLGCGVVRTPDSHKAIVEIITRSQKPMVLDAEALHAIASLPEIVKGKRALLTPNAGEFQVLTGKTWPAAIEKRTTAVETLARKYDSVVIVKGSPDLVSDGRRTYVDQHGSPYMTKGGYGDLLAGVAGAHLARRAAPYDAARVAAYIVGKAGELAANKFGESTLASDVLQYFPAVIRMR